MRTFVVLGALLFAHAVHAEQVERETAASPRGEVQIVNLSGDVRVIGWDQPKVRMQADLGRGVEEVEFERDADLTRIRVKWPREKEAGATDLTIHVPRESTLQIKTVSASQTIENVSGEQRLQSVSGEIRTSVGSEDLDAKTVSGEIRVKGSGKSSSSRVSTVSGAIDLEQMGGQFELTTVNGTIELRSAQIEEARFNTTNGEIRIEGELAEDGRVAAEAINGAIRLNLRGKVDAEFDIESFNGEIKNCFGPKARRTSQYGPGTALRFEEGDGDARVRIKTLNGAIEVCKK